jgi:hypothetical protein
VCPSWYARSPRVPPRNSQRYWEGPILRLDELQADLKGERRTPYERKASPLRIKTFYFQADFGGSFEANTGRETAGKVAARQKKPPNAFLV